MGETQKLLPVWRVGTHMIEPGGTGLPSYSQSMPRTSDSAHGARRLVSAVLRHWELETAEDAACLVATELISNAVMHARMPTIRVIVTRQGERLVRLSVVDRSRALPQPHTANPDDESGRGLRIVAALCEDRWGTDLLRWGKRVWADVPAR